MMRCFKILGSTEVFFSPYLSFRVGTYCNCSDDALSQDVNQCKAPGMAEPCSGHGDCLPCGTCVCHNPEKFEGPYCQYDKTQCQRFGGFLCNGTTVLESVLLTASMCDVTITAYTSA